MSANDEKKDGNTVMLLFKSEDIITHDVDYQIHYKSGALITSTEAVLVK